MGPVGAESRSGKTCTGAVYCNILLNGTPKSWQRKMDQQGFDPLGHTLNKVVTFMEQIEASKDFTGENPHNLVAPCLPPSNMLAG